MSSIVNKVKDALHSDKDKTGTHSTTHTTSHTSSTSSTEPRVHHSPNTATGTGIGGTGDSSYGGNENYTVGGTGVNNRGTDGPATRTDGPHSSNLANKADPRVDSDRDHSRNMGMNPEGSATTGSSTYNTHNTTGTGLTGTHNTTATGPGVIGGSNLAGADGRTAPATRTDGPHEFNLANKADPRVDSDRDHSRNMGMNPHGTATTGTRGTHGTHGTTGASAFGNTGISSGVGTNRGSDGPATRTDGPHSSNLANKADPRVDSDRDHSRNMGANPHGTANTGTYDSSAYGSTTTGTHGTHGTHTTGTHGHTGTHTGVTGSTGIHSGSGPGPAANTAGPHKSDMMNKMDPRVDSDLDGSKTVGGNKTYAQS